MIDFATIGQTATQGDAQSEAARTTLSSNFDTFLKLLIAQLANQDPLDPVDSAQFTQQLVQYSQVEQQILTNERLSGLSDTLGAQIQATSAGAAVAFIGQYAEFTSDAATLANGEAKWTYQLADAAQNVKLTVKDASGRTIYEESGPAGKGEHPFTWDGRSSAGDPQGDGIYFLKVEATDAAGEAIATSTTVREMITGVDLSSDVASVMTATGRRTFDSILRITAPS